MPILLTFFLSSISTLAIVHHIALELYLYWHYVWLDIPMHFLGGASVIFGIAILPFFRVVLPQRFDTLLVHVSVVVVIGLAWEFFEIAFGISVLDEHFLPDTLLDMVMDIVGGVVGYGIVKHIQKL